MRTFKLEIYVPVKHSDAVKNALFTAGAGAVGNYDCCCWSTPGSGQFRPLPGSTPFVGQENKIEKIDEIKLELICSSDKLKAAVKAMLEAHPYETPAWNCFEVMTSLNNI